MKGTNAVMKHPFGHPKVKAQRDQMAGHAKALVSGKAVSSMKDAKAVNFGQMPKGRNTNLPF